MIIMLKYNLLVECEKTVCEISTRIFSKEKPRWIAASNIDLGKRAVRGNSRQGLTDKYIIHHREISFITD